MYLKIVEIDFIVGRRGGHFLQRVCCKIEAHRAVDWGKDVKLVVNPTGDDAALERGGKVEQGRGVKEQVWFLLSRILSPPHTTLTFFFDTRLTRLPQCCLAFIHRLSL